MAFDKSGATTFKTQCKDFNIHIQVKSIDDKGEQLFIYFFWVEADVCITNIGNDFSSIT